MKNFKIIVLVILILILKNQGSYASTFEFGNTRSYNNLINETTADTTVNVKSFGAVGNGLNDDTKSIDAALKAADNKLKLYFPAGTYIVNKSFDIKTGIIGAGEDKTTIKLSSYSLLDLDAWIFTVSANNVLMTKFTLDGNRSKNSGTPVKGIGGIFGDHIQRFTIKNVTIKDTRSMGLMLRNFPKSVLSFVTISNCGRYGQEVSKGYQADRLGVLLMNTLMPGAPYYCGNDVKINNITITGAGMDGLSSSVGTTYYKVIANYCGAEMAKHDPGAAGIYFRSNAYVNQTVFDHCEAHHNTGIGIDVGNLPNTSKLVFKNVKILNCYASYNNLNGIGIAGLQYGTIKNCTAWNNGQLISWSADHLNYRRAGITINGSENVETSNIIIENNTCYDNQKIKTQTCGLMIGTHFLKGGGTASNYIIRNNNFMNNIHDGIERNTGEENMEVVTTGFLSIQNNKGISVINDSVKDNTKISPISPVINLTAARPANIIGIKQGLKGDKVTLKNISPFTLTLVYSDDFLVTGKLEKNQSVTFQCIDGVKWKKVLTTQKK
ncbi:MAG: glycosyl hydrolase family 28-related protein [Mucilaginibacter sp.]